jgi:hypothetical protein
MREFRAPIFSIVLGLVLRCSELGAQQPAGASPAPQPLCPATSLPAYPPPRVTASPPLAASCGPPTCKVCVREPKHNTRWVFGCKSEEYCLPYCSPFSLFWGGCGCEDGPCGAFRIRHRLVIKKVDTCDTTTCVVREVPVTHQAPPVPAQPFRR